MYLNLYFKWKGNNKKNAFYVLKNNYSNEFTIISHIFKFKYGE